VLLRVGLLEGAAAGDTELGAGVDGLDMSSTVLATGVGCEADMGESIAAKRWTRSNWCSSHDKIVVKFLLLMGKKRRQAISVKLAGDQAIGPAKFRS